jgi:hypothetical protein
MRKTDQRWNSLTTFFVEVSVHKLEAFQTRVSIIQNAFYEYTLSFLLSRIFLYWFLKSEYGAIDSNPMWNCCPRVPSQTMCCSYYQKDKLTPICSIILCPPIGLSILSVLIKSFFTFQPPPPHLPHPLLRRGQILATIFELRRQLAGVVPLKLPAVPHTGYKTAAKYRD